MGNIFGFPKSRKSIKFSSLDELFGDELETGKGKGDTLELLPEDGGKLERVREEAIWRTSRITGLTFFAL